MDPQDVLDNVAYARAFNSEHQGTLLDQEMMKERRVRYCLSLPVTACYSALLQVSL